MIFSQYSTSSLILPLSLLLVISGRPTLMLDHHWRRGMYPKAVYLRCVSSLWLRRTQILVPLQEHVRKRCAKCHRIHHHMTGRAVHISALGAEALGERHSGLVIHTNRKQGVLLTKQARTPPVHPATVLVSHALQPAALMMYLPCTMSCITFTDS